MAVKTFRPTSPAVRQMTVTDYSVLTKKEPEKSLLVTGKKTGGRNSYGRITVRHIGGGNRKHIRIIDWKRNKDNIPAKVVAIEYDPNRTAFSFSTLTVRRHTSSALQRQRSVTLS